MSSSWRSIRNREAAALRLAAVLLVPARVALARVRHRAPQSALPDNVIFVGNHRSVFDVVVGLDWFRKQARSPQIAVHHRYFENALLRSLLRTVGAEPTGPGRGTAWFSSALDHLREGGDVALMPQGRITTSDEIGRIFSGAARLSLASGRPIVAVAATGTDVVWPVGRRLPILKVGRPEVVVQVGEVIEPGDQSAAELSRRTGDTLQELFRLARA